MDLVNLWIASKVCCPNWTKVSPSTTLEGSECWASLELRRPMSPRRRKVSPTEPTTIEDRCSEKDGAFVERPSGGRPTGGYGKALGKLLTASMRHAKTFKNDKWLSIDSDWLMEVFFMFEVLNDNFLIKCTFSRAESVASLQWLGFHDFFRAKAAAKCSESSNISHQNVTFYQRMRKHMPFCCTLQQFLETLIWDPKSHKTGQQFTSQLLLFWLFTMFIYALGCKSVHGSSYFPTKGLDRVALTNLV